MRSKPARGQFDLEALEPRVLLSAQCSPAPIPVTAEVSSTAIVEQSDVQAPTSAITYDSAAQVDDIFDDASFVVPASAAPPAEAGTTNTANQSDQQTTVQDQGQPAPTDTASANVQSGAAENTNPFPEQLTETLHAANGPPTHYTGVKFNGVPFDQSGGDTTGGVLQMATGDVLSGNGLVNAAVVVNGTISPGNSPGFLQTSSQTWVGNSFPYDWEINHISAGEGTNPGWDFEKINGILAITATSATPATIRVKSLLLNNAPGQLGGFIGSNAYTWRILSTTGGITGFNRDAVKLDITGFTPYNSIGTGAFLLDLSADSRDLLLRFVPTLPYLSFDQPIWVSQGPDYITGNGNSILPPDNPATGAVQAFAAHPIDPNIAWIGTVNGGVWMTNNLSSPTPLWNDIGQDLPSIGVTALAVSKFDRNNLLVTNSTPLSQIVIFAASGSFSSSGRGAMPTGLFRSLDGGAHWAEVDNFDYLRATVIVPSSLTAGLVYVGTYDVEAPGTAQARGGLYRSTNNGDSFTRLSGQNGLPEFHVSDFAEDPGTAGRFYVALAGETKDLNAADIGIYRTNNGQTGSPTWTKVDSSILPDYDHDNVGGESDLDDDVNNNNILDPSEDLDGDRVLDNGEDTNNNGELDEGELDFNGDGVANTVNIAENLENADRIRLSVSAATGNTVYAAVIGRHDGRLAGVFASTNFGGVWFRLGNTPTTNHGQGWLHFGIAADPTDNSKVYIAGDASYEAPEDGVVWRWDGQWSRISAKSVPDSGNFSTTAPHADIRNLAFDLTNTRFMALTDGGVYRLPNPRLTNGSWSFISRGVNVAEISSVAYDRSSNTIFAGVQDNGVIAQKPAQNNWYGLLTGDGNNVGVAYINPLSPFFSTRFYMGNNFRSFQRAIYDNNDTLLLTTDILLKAPGDLSNFSGLDNTITLGGATDFAFQGFRHLPFALNAVDDLSDGKMKLVLGRIGLYVSDDNGDHIVLAPGWNLKGEQEFVTALAYGGKLGGINDQNIIYAGLSTGEIMVSKDNGGRFQQVKPTGAGEIHQVSMDPENWRTAFAVDEDHVWAIITDANGTPTAFDITGNLPDITGAFQSVEAINVKGQLVVLVGTRDGVYRLSVGDVNGLTSNPSTYALWNHFGYGLPNVQVADLQFDPVDNVLIAGTRGRGAWKIINAADSILAQPVLRYDAVGSPGTELEFAL